MNDKNSDYVKYEREFSRFLKSRIHKFGGSIELQHITGHLSQVKPEVRDAIGTSKIDIIKFIDKHYNTFICKNNFVSLVKLGEPYDKRYEKDYDSDDSSVDIEAFLPAQIKDGRGVVVKLCPTFGFIKSQHPVKSSVFFRANHFGFADDVNLTECGINIGTMVSFNACKEKRENLSSKYKAIKVWKNDKNDEENVVVHNPRKNRQTGIYDPINFDGDGFIQNVFPTHGFISANGDVKNTVFFYKNRVANYENIVDLTKVFENGDLVEFSAHRTTKENTKARWEATKVWKKSKRNPSVNEFNDRKKDVPSKSNASVISSITSKSNASVKSSITSKSNASAISSITPKSSSSVISSCQSPTLPGFYSKSIPSKVDVKQKGPEREMIYNQTGKICPRSNGSVIKFGENFKELADGDSSTYYISGTKVTDISWEFTEGEDVKFDAMKIKSSPGWKALLVWTGEKPNIVLSPLLGDFGEFTDEEIDEMPDEVDETPNEVVNVINDGDIAEISDDTESSASDYQRSLSSHSSLKSVSMLSDTSDCKTKRLPDKNDIKSNMVPDTSDFETKRLPTDKEFSRIKESAANTEDRNTSNEGFKLRNLCNSPSRSSSRSSSSSIESKMSHLSKDSKSSRQSKSSKTSHQSKDSKTSHQSKDSKMSHKSKDSKMLHQSKDSKMSPLSKEFDVGKYSRNGLDFPKEKSVTSFRDISESPKNNESISESKSDNITDVSDAKPKIVSKKSYANQRNTAPHSVWHEFSECSKNSEIEDNFKNTNIIVESEQTEIKSTASITKHKNISGIITKVYATFAEAKSTEFQNPVAFSWNIFYFNGNSMDALDLSDLREVIKVGETIYFNRFEIVDDDGQSWQKVSLAWNGRKPIGVVEMTPDEFIQQNGLYVTIKDEPNSVQPQKTHKKFLIGHDEISPNNPDELGVSQKKFLIGHDEISPNNLDELGVSQKKFLSGHDEISPNNSDELGVAQKKFLIGHDEISPNYPDELVVSQTESCSEDDELTFHSPVAFIESKVLEETSSGFKYLSSMISQKLMLNRDILVDSKMDLNSLSAEIVSLVLEQYNIKESSSSLEKLEKETSSVTCSCGKMKSTSWSSQNENTKNSAVQTICTGEIMAQNIYTES